TYAPYAKWFGTAFQRLRCASELRPYLEGALSANDWRTREGHLVHAYEVVARIHNELGVTEPVPDTAASFHGRPFLVIHADRYARWVTDGPIDRVAVHHLRDLVERLPRGAHVVDLGCGGGDRWPHHDQITLTGVDISFQQLRRAREVLPSARLIQADMTRLDL